MYAAYAFITTNLLGSLTYYYHEYAHLQGPWFFGVSADLSPAAKSYLLTANGTGGVMAGVFKAIISDQIITKMSSSEAVVTIYGLDRINQRTLPLVGPCHFHGVRMGS